MDSESGVVVIDLGYERGEPDSYRNPGRSTVQSWFPALIMAALLLVCAGASDPPAKSPLSPVLRVQVGPADAYALTTDGALLAQTFGQLTSYDLKDGQVRWQAGQASPAFRLRLTDGLLLLRPWTTGLRDPGTTAVSLANGVSRWQRDGNVLTVDGSSALLAVEPVKSYAGANRRVEGPIDALDPLTGQTRWTVNVPGSGVVLGVPGTADNGARMLLVQADRTMALHDLVDGAKLAATTIPAADYGPDNPSVAGGVIILRHPGNNGMEISAYDPGTLRQLWTEPADEAYLVKQCGVLACLIGQNGVRAIDPATGDTRWRRPEWKDIDATGAMYVAYSGEAGHAPAALVDPDTGAVRVDLAGWLPIGGNGGKDHLLVTRAVDAGARTMVAVARPGDREPRLLADLPAGTGDCQAVPGRLVCRSMYGELVVWAYREG
jgi:outer membrane protein assembly factor BamB